MDSDLTMGESTKFGKGLEKVDKLFSIKGGIRKAR
jgi:hypothetical protein